MKVCVLCTWVVMRKRTHVDRFPWFFLYNEIQFPGSEAAAGVTRSVRYGEVRPLSVGWTNRPWSFYPMFYFTRNRWRAKK